MKSFLRLLFVTLVAAFAAGSLLAQSTYNPAYAFSTLAGSSSLGSTNGTGSAARFYKPTGVAVDSAGIVYVADSVNNTIRKITAGGVVTTLAGKAGSKGSVNGTGSAARFYKPTGVAVDSAGNVYVADTSNQTIRKITSGGVVTTLAGTAGIQGSTDGTGSTARCYLPNGVAVDSAGTVYVADSSNNIIRKITSLGVVTTLAGTAGSKGSTDGTGSVARFYQPKGVAVDAAGNVYVADTSNQTIRKITSVGLVTTLAGMAGKVGSANGTGSAARFNNPTGVAVDTAGRVYVADSSNNMIRSGSLPTSPTLTSPTSTSLTATTATLGGNVTSAGGSSITARGVVYAVTTANSNPRLVGTGVTTLAGTGTTGVFTVSGTGLAPGTAYSYAAYATNSFGTGYTNVGTFNTLSSDATLSGLVLSSGTLAPTFFLGTTNYTAGVTYGTTSLTVTPTVAQANATVAVNGSTVVSGNASGSIGLSVGVNTITSVVTAQDGTTRQIYTVTVTRAATVPGAPTAVTAIAGNTQATVSFTAPANNGGATITGYTVTSSPGNFTATGAASPLTVTGLTNGTAYTFTVVATNSVGAGAASSPSTAVTPVTPATVPGAPTDVTAIAGNTQATVSFTAPANNGGATITGYTVTSSPGNFTATGAASPLTVTGLTNGTAYTFTVVATNSVGAGAGTSTTNATVPSTTNVRSILGSLGDFTLFGGTAITSTGVVGTTIVNGNVGLSPGATTGITGFPPAVVIAPNGIIGTGGVTGQARLDLIKASVGLAGLASTANLSDVDMNGMTLTPGVYTFNAAAGLTGTLTLDAQGRNNVCWVIQIGTALTTSANSMVKVINLGTNGGRDNGIFWNVGSAITFGANNEILGNYLAGTSITFGTLTSGAGRALVLAAITLDNTIIDAHGGPDGSDWTGGLVYDLNGNVVPFNP